jgi:hypothetical protein
MCFIYLLFIYLYTSTVHLYFLLCIGARYVCAQFKFKAVRKPEWYIYNVLLTSWLIVTASFSVFFIPEDNISERLGMIFT